MASPAATAERTARQGRLTGVALVVGAAALFGTIGTARVLGPDASSWSVGALRLLVAVAVLVALARWLDGPGRLLALVRRPESIWAGLGQAAFQLTFLTAVEQAGVAVATLVAIGSAPLVTGVLTRSVTPRWLLGTGTALAGLGLLVAGSGDLVAAERSAEAGTGLLLALGAGVAYAVYTTASARLAAGATPAPPTTVTAAAFVVAAALLAPALAFTDNGWAATTGGVALVGYLAVAATAGAYLLFVRGLRSVPPATAQTLGLAEPVVATALGVLVLGERIGPVGVLGAGLVVTGLVLLSRRGGFRPGDGRTPG